ncbi:thiamine-phosphate kinase [Rhodococcus sp. G-MC3]|uniref:thiamine-phosphate kinase n=1 Tax=Rhodococcus sp. G-MC3 TaxID=3046209 RepID=UPI0024BA7DE3|nr:thiamine-phosphate kinase [Rhodococcus sp. G-MC3]MDJ0391958.1 thiamine-phosphate kinase [Rhodococcus sp. G-MC3]
MPSPTVGQVGEFAVIDRATAGRVQSRHTLLGPGDDAAVVAAPDRRVVVTTDMLVHGRHFRLDWSSPADVGRKAIAQNGADIAAMGARCTGFVVALACPADTSVDITDGLTDGLWSEAERAGASIVGGDLVQCETLVISITALGDLEGRTPVLRSGARPGDVVAVAGRLGWSAAGLAVLESGLSGHHAVVDAHRVPTPAYEQGVMAATAGATSLTDISDGLSADLGHIATASGVGIDIVSEFVRIDDEIHSAASDLNVSALGWALTGGEDHALAGTFPSKAVVPEGWTVIGRVVGKDAPVGVTVDGASYSGAAGWSSFETS